MAKYYLNAMLNDNPILTITSGKLEDIDNFIINNNIRNIEELYDHIKDNINEVLKDDVVSFAVQYKYKGVIKEKPLIYRNDLMNFIKCNNKDSFIYELMGKDSKFRAKFESKYVNELFNIVGNNSILASAYDYKYEFNFKTFSRLYISLITKKKKANIDNKTFDTCEELEEALNTRIYSYRSQRDMYFDAYFYNKLTPNNRIIINNYSKEDEFDEEMLHDQNPNTDIVHITKNEKIENNYEWPKNKRAKQKKLIFENENQLSLFLDK